MHVNAEYTYMECENHCIMRLFASRMTGEYMKSKGFEVHYYAN